MPHIIALSANKSLLVNGRLGAFEVGLFLTDHCHEALFKIGAGWVECAQRSFEDHTAGMDDSDPVANLADIGQDVGAEKNGPALLAQFF